MIIAVIQCTWTGFLVGSEPVELHSGVGPSNMYTLYTCDYMLLLID